MLERAKQVLGCSDMDSCRALCETPSNRDKCMSFAKQHAPEEIRKGVEEREKVLRQARENLGCNSFEECKSYCDNDANRDKCSRFASQNSSGEIRQKREENRSCSTEEECRRMCEENQDLCPGFGEAREKERRLKEEGEKKRLQYEQREQYQNQNYPTGTQQYNYPTSVPQQNYSQEDYQRYKEQYQQNTQ